MYIGSWKPLYNQTLLILVSEVYFLSTNSTDEKGEHIFSVINEKAIRIKQRFQLVAHTFMKAKKYYHV